MPTRSRSRLFTFALLGIAMVAAAAPDAGLAESDQGPKLAGMIESDAPTRGERAVKVALAAVGTPYRWGGESPASGFDCSGLVRWAYGRVGVDLPHNSYALYTEGRRVRETSMEPGDILFFEGLGHVGLYLGNGRMVHAPQTGRNVEIVRLGSTNFGARLVAARRITAA
jgi:cell wall-associated NlpC family hydrolase